MDKEKQMDDSELDAVVGGVSGTAAPLPTGGVTYKCAACGTTISASTRDVRVTCPNVRCRCEYMIKNGKLVAVAASL